MPLDDRDAAYLWDMLEAAKEAENMIGDKDLSIFIEDRILQRAIERVVEVIGESARRVSIPGREAAPNIHWREIIGQRNILAHEYGQIDHEVLYRTVIDDIPDLIRHLDEALPPVDEV